MKECDIQSSAVTWFRNTYPEYVLFSVSNEGCYKRKNYFEGLGMLKGVSDVVVLLPNNVLFIEFKSPKGVQRLEQREFENRCLNLGFPYYVCRSLEQFKDIIQSNLST